MTVLVTGASGFIGSHLCLHLRQQLGAQDPRGVEDQEIVGVFRDLVPSKWLNASLGTVTKAFGDLRDPGLINRLIIQYGVDQIYHLAAQPVVKNALRDPTATYQNNVICTLNVLEAARILDVPRTLVMSTDKVYGDKIGADEDFAPYVPTDPYSTSKICCDAIARSYIKTYNLPVVIPRSCNAYGYDTAKRIVPNTIRACLRGESPVIFKGEETMRQYIYVEDLVATLAHLLPSPFYQGPVNVVGPLERGTTPGDLLSQEQVVRTILYYFPGLEPRYVGREKPPEISQQSMARSKHPDLKQFLKHSFEQGIEKTILRFKDFGRRS